MFGFLRSYFSNDLAIDLGTANTLIYMRGKGIVLDEPSVVSIRQEGGPNGKKTIQAVGKEAKQMLGKVPGNIEAIRPDEGRRDRRLHRHRADDQAVHQDGARVADVLALAAHHHLRAVRRRPRSSAVQIKEAAHGAGASQVYLIEEPMAAAIGAGLPVRADRQR
jgi:rod shape-determining protein MreB